MSFSNLNNNYYSSNSNNSTLLTLNVLRFIETYFFNNRAFRSKLYKLVKETYFAIQSNNPNCTNNENKENTFQEETDKMYVYQSLVSIFQLLKEDDVWLRSLSYDDNMNFIEQCGKVHCITDLAISKKLLDVHITRMYYKLSKVNDYTRVDFCKLAPLLVEGVASFNKHKSVDTMTKLQKLIKYLNNQQYETCDVSYIFNNISELYTLRDRFNKYLLDKSEHLSFEQDLDYLCNLMQLDFKKISTKVLKVKAFITYWFYKYSTTISDGLDVPNSLMENRTEAIKQLTEIVEQYCSSQRKDFIQQFYNWKYKVRTYDEYLNDENKIIMFKHYHSLCEKMFTKCGIMKEMDFECSEKQIYSFFNKWTNYYKASDVLCNTQQAIKGFYITRARSLKE